MTFGNQSENYASSVFGKCKALVSPERDSRDWKVDMLSRVSIKKSFAISCLFAACTLTASAQHFVRTDLTADVSATSATAPNTDANLVNAWGLSRGSATPWWVSDNGTGLSTLYDAAGVPQSLVVTIPLPPGTSGSAAPTGTVFNYTGQFMIGGKAPLFLFVTEDGTISGWIPGSTTASLAVKRPGKAIYKGCAIAQSSSGPRLYATNFQTGRVEVYDTGFQPVNLKENAFRLDGIQHSYVPFNIQNVGGNLVVTFAHKSAGSEDEDHGAGLGYVGIFDANGRLLQRLEHGKWLNAPWGVAMAPSDFGTFAHRLLIGNFGDGTIDAYDPISGRFLGTLLNSTGGNLVVDGLWAISFGSNGRSGLATDLYFTAGPNDEKNGLFGKITAVPAEQRGNTE